MFCVKFLFEDESRKQCPTERYFSAADFSSFNFRGQRLRNFRNQETFSQQEFSTHGLAVMLMHIGKLSPKLSA
jgi:hypothetical protein